jgi:GcrA cell cycle regulator
MSSRSSMESPWNDVSLQALRQLWGEGRTASQIAALLGLTRNQVIGKAHRLGLDGRPSPIKGDKPARLPTHQRAITGVARERKLRAAAETPQQPAAAPSRAAAGAAEAPPPPARPRAAAGLPSRASCAWPIGDPRAPGFHFCGETPVVPGRPYCVEHCYVAYRKVAAE